MAGSLNKVLLIGRLGADPEIKQMVNGKNVARLSLATSNTWKDKNTGRRRCSGHATYDLVQRIPRAISTQKPRLDSRPAQKRRLSSRQKLPSF